MTTTSTTNVSSKNKKTKKQVRTYVATITVTRQVEHDWESAQDNDLHIDATIEEALAQQVKEELLSCIEEELFGGGTVKRSDVAVTVAGDFSGIQTEVLL